MVVTTVITDIDEVDTTATIIHTDVITKADIEVDTTQVTRVQATSTTELHQAGIPQKHGAIPSERGNRTCKFGYT